MSAEGSCAVTTAATLNNGSTGRNEEEATDAR
jgi:hypothetical protein